ncbi:MAG: response regulator [Bifidobacteriaceae bacterium]|nr:response regulator [Bifidobacteriaceae bacterium]
MTFLLPEPDSLDPAVDDARARAVLWDATVGSTLGIGVGFGLFVDRLDKPPWLPFVCCMAALTIIAVAYAPRTSQKAEASHRRWLRTACPVFNLGAFGWLAASMAFGLYENSQSPEFGALVFKLGLITFGIVVVYVVFLVRGMPWAEGVAAWRWWTTAVLTGALLAAGTWLAPTVGLFQVVLFTALWAAAGSSASIFRMLAGAGLIVVLVGIAVASARGVVTALLCQIPPLILSVVTGLWMRSSWRWSAERRILTAQLDSAVTALTAAESESAVIAERERMAREIHDTIAQSLVGIIMTAERSLDRLAAPDSREPGLAEDLAVITASAYESLANARGLVAVGARLHMEGPLDEALASLAGRFSRETGVVVDAKVDLPGELPEHLRLIVVRTAQEGLANIRKHAHAAHATISVICKDQCLRITVTDDGVGPAGFDSSSGFGLVGLRDRIESIGGKVDLRPRPGRSGSVLSVVIDQIGAAAWVMTGDLNGLQPPADKDRPAGPTGPTGPTGPDAALAPVHEPPAKTTVVVVDDHPIVRRGLVELLNREPDIQVVGEAETGEEAVRVAARLDPDVVMMDLEMPGQGGVWATSQIVSDAAQAGRSTRVLAATVFESDARIIQAIRAGACEYWVKAHPPEVFVRAVRRVAAGRPLRSTTVEAALAAGKDALSPREVEVLRLAAKGLSNKQIAGHLTVQPSTVKTQLSRIYLKLDVPDRTAAVTEAMANGWI